MLHTKNDPQGIDLYIDRIQRKLYSQLIAKWSGDIKHESWGRCSRNLVNNQYQAELYNPAKPGNYIDTLWNDSADVVSFYGEDVRVITKTQKLVGIHLIVFCNVKKLKPAAAGRADEEVRIDFTNLIGKCMYAFHLQSIEFGIENVLREYKGSIAKVKTIDTGSLHAFRLNFQLSYNPNFSASLKLKT